MAAGSQDGAGKKLIFAISLLTGLWMTYQAGGQFYARSAPILNRMIHNSELWLWSDLIVGLWFIASWVVFFVIACIAVQLLLSVITGWLLARFF